MTLSQPGSDERRYMRPNNDQTTTTGGKTAGRQGGRRAVDRREPACSVLCNLSPLSGPTTRGSKGPEARVRTWYWALLWPLFS